MVSKKRVLDVYNKDRTLRRAMGSPSRANTFEYYRNVHYPLPISRVVWQMFPNKKVVTTQCIIIIHSTAPKTKSSTCGNHRVPSIGVDADYGG